MNGVTNEQILNNAFDTVLATKADLIQELHTSLVTDFKSKAGNLPESIWVQYFLPYFSGASEFKDNPKVYSDWLSIAGGPSHEVNILGPDGSVLFIVPKIESTELIKIGANTTSMREITNMSMLLDRSGNSSTNYAITEYEKMFNEMVDTNHINEDDLNKWLYIFKRYNINTGATPALSNVNSSVSNDGDDGELIDA